MRLTHSRTASSEDTFPTTQFLILASCRLAEPIAITSIFPYAWQMVRSFQVGSENDASLYCGILIACFSLAESLSSMFWGSLSDRYGRKPIVLLGCCGTCVSLLTVGFSTSFTIALLGRILGGLLNGNIGVIQTMVGELVKSPVHEPKAYSIMPFVWSIGTVIGPSIGGLLANPAEAYPNTFSRNGFFGQHPWVLPNLVCTSFMMLSIVATYLFLDETHPDFCKGADPFLQHEFAEQTPVITAAGVTADPAVDLRHELYGTFNDVDGIEPREGRTDVDGLPRPDPFSEKALASGEWLTWPVAMLTAALGLFTYHSMSYDHLMPIFFQDERIEEVSVSSLNFLHIPGGLGLTTKDTGVIMSLNGIIALFVQAVVFPFAAERAGVWRVFVFVTVFHPVAYFIVPYLALLPSSLVYPGIYTCLAIRNLLSILAYPVLLILLKQASVQPSVLGRINGLAASAGAACRTVAPPVAGLLYGWGTEMNFTGLAWWGAGAVALVGTAQLYFIPRERILDPASTLLLPGLREAQDDLMASVEATYGE